MPCLDVFATIEVGDGTGDFQNPIVRAGRESQAVHGIFQDSAAVLVQVTICEVIWALAWMEGYSA